MIKMRPYAPPERVAIRDSIDEEVSDDVEDDVFIRDGKSTKISEEKGLKRPLMAPRRKSNKNVKSPISIMKKRRRCWKCCEPFCYGLAALTVLIALIFLAALILTLFPIPLQKIKVWLKHEHPLGIVSTYGGAYEIRGPELVPCSQISVQKVWSQTFSRLISESPIRKVDLNGDKVLDVIFGYGVDDNIQYEDILLPKCSTSKQNDGEVPCEGGIIALNGVSGEVLWQKWAVANVFSIFCTSDIDGDGYLDCVAAGRKGLLFCVNGRNGNVIWQFREIDVETNSPIIIDLYTINSVRDLNDDEVPDILAVHVEERESSKAGHVKLICGKTGKVIRSIPTPYREEVFVPLQVIQKFDGTELILIITGGQNTPGGVYTIRLLSLMKFISESQFTKIIQTDYSGFMVPSILTDINGDSVEDIIVAAFNATIFAFDGKNYTMIWNYTFPASESVSSIVPGHFDHDNVTDFMIKYNTGPGFPIYYYSQTAILNGINGQPLLNSMMTDSGGPNSLLGGISISQTFGGDFFLHWQVQCRDKAGAKDAYEFLPDSDVILQARADTCLLRYNTSTILKLYAIARHVEPPGAVIFSSDDLNVKLNRTLPRQLDKKVSISPFKHPKMKKILLKEYLASDSQPISILRNRERILQGKDLSSSRESSSDFTRRLNTNILNSDDEDGGAPVDVGMSAADSARIFEPQMKPYFPYLPRNEDLGRDFKELEQEPRNQPEEYDGIYNEEQNDGPIRLRSKYPQNNRDVRSDVLEANMKSYLSTVANASSIFKVKDQINMTETRKDTAQETNKSKHKQHEEEALNLWDLELEKEEEEALKESHKYDDFRERNRREDDTNSGSKDSTESDPFLVSISAGGVLLPSLNEKITSSIDFVFALNVRESEAYPPLFLQQDLNCVEDKLSAYKSYTSENLLELERQFVTQCIKDRLGEISPLMPKYESQIVITRLSITCTCGNLEPNEICSKLEDYNDQRWTEYMGNYGTGSYRT